MILQFNKDGRLLNRKYKEEENKKFNKQTW